MKTVLNAHAKRRRNGPLKRPSSPTPVEEEIAQNRNDSRSVRSRKHSLRDLNAKNFNQGDHVLQIELRSLRKKLNFKSSLQKSEEPARKRTKTEDLDCQAFLAVWDNREGFRANVEPIFKTSEPCKVAPMGNLNDSPWAIIEMGRPFKINARELFVPPPPKLKQPAGVGIGDNYLMEIKIIPINASRLWPPIPLLNKNEESLNRDTSKRALGYEEGMLVACYNNLPESPPLDAPLPIAFDRHSRTYQTKYCIEVRAKWNHPATPLEAYFKDKKKDQDQVDVDKYPWHSANGMNGNVAVRDNEHDDSRSRRRVKGAMEKSENDDAQKTNGSGVWSKRKRRRTVNLSYRFDMIQPEASQRQAPFLDTVKVLGFCCPFCRSKNFHKLQRLRFHLTNDHEKYRFDVENQEDDFDGRPSSVCFKVGFADIARPRAANHVKDERDFDWQAPSEPFDIDGYLDGDTTWVGVPPRRRTAPSKVSGEPVDSPFRPTSDVPPLIRNIRPPPKVPKSRTRIETPLYRSVSHQIVRTGETLSESDDDIGKEWLSMKHADTLDPSLSKSSRNFLARLDAHLISENLANTKYLSDAVVRFTRANKEILREPAMLQEFSHLMAELIDQDLTGAHVLAGCMSIIQGKDEPKITEERKLLNKAVIRRSATDKSTPSGSTPGSDEEADIGPPMPTTRSCNKCHNIIRGTKANIACSNTSCKAPLYHLACMGLHQKSSQWMCPACAVNVPQDPVQQTSAWLANIMN